MSLSGPGNTTLGHRFGLPSRLRNRGALLEIAERVNVALSSVRLQLSSVALIDNGDFERLVRRRSHRRVFRAQSAIAGVVEPVTEHAGHGGIALPVPRERRFGGLRVPRRCLVSVARVLRKCSGTSCGTVSCAALCLTLLSADDLVRARSSSEKRIPNAQSALH